MLCWNTTLSSYNLMKQLRNCHLLTVCFESHHWLKIFNTVGGFETAVMVFCNRQTDGWIGHLSMIYALSHTIRNNTVACNGPDRFQKIRNGNGSAQWAVGEAIFYPLHDRKKYTPYQRISTYIIKATLLFYKSHLKVVL